MDQNKVLNRWIAAAMLIVASFVYLVTAAPDVSFWDAGEFIACSYTLSVMHPPGAPLYILLGRIFTFLPISNIAFRINLMSVFSSALTIMFLYLIIVRLINQFRGKPQNYYDRLLVFGSAAIGALSFAFSDSFWFNAVEAEVYAISMLFTAIVVWLILLWGDNSEDNKNLSYLVLIVYLFSLATGIHLLNILTFLFVLFIIHLRKNESAKKLVWVLFFQALIPLTLYILFFNYNPASMGYEQFLAHQAKAGTFLKYAGLVTLAITLYYLYAKDQLAFKLWWLVPILFVIGYSTYIVIYIRSGLNPPIDENDPERWSSMMDYLARKQYGEQSLLLTIFHRKAEFWAYQFQKMYIRYFNWQFIGKGTTIGSDGYIIEVFSLKGLLGIPFIAGIVGAYYHFRKDKMHAFSVLTLFIATGVAIIFYLNQENPQPRERDYVYVGSFFAFAIWIGIGVYAIFESLREFLSEENKLLKPITWATLFILGIALPINMFLVNFDSHDRRGNFVPYDYSYNILESCEPNAIIFTNGDNDTFPLWYLQYVKHIREDIRIVNLSLLNTSWYILQLKNQEPKVPFTYTDQQIERIGLMGWPGPTEYEVPISQLVYDKFKTNMMDRGEWKDDLVDSGSMKFTINPTIGSPPQALRVQDLAILNIIAANQWKKPIYFAVTVGDNNKVGLQSYLRMDGMAFKLLPYPNVRISVTRLQENLFEKFLFRNLNDPKVYLDDKTKGLLTNYRTAFIRLADHYRIENDNEKALTTLDKMEELIPESNVPFTDYRFGLSIGHLYETLGRPEELERRAWEIIERNPKLRDAYAALLGFYQRTENYEKAVELMNKYLEQYPTDEMARQLLSDFQSKLTPKDSVKTQDSVNTQDSVKTQDSEGNQ